MKALPTADDLARLTLRAIAVYAARCARRGTLVLRGILDDEMIDAPLRMAEKLGSDHDLGVSDGVAAPLAASRIARAMQAQHTHQAVVAALCLTRVADVVQGVLNAATGPDSPEWARSQAMHAARSAAAIPCHAVHALDGQEAAAGVDAARSDYEVLRTEFGEHEEVVLGEPIELCEQWWGSAPRVE